MTPQEKKKWVAALRSGKYRQARGRLMRGNQHGKQYCCLGVAAVVCGAPLKDKDILQYSWLSEIDQNYLIQLNDVELRSFSYIADYIEKEL